MYQPTSKADGIFSHGVGPSYAYGAQRTAHADGSLGEYAYGARTSSFADGSLGGCSSCSGMGALTPELATKVLSAMQPQLPAAPPMSPVVRGLLIGGGVLVVAAIGYAVMKKKG
jgi:hypothetical protein